MAMALRPCLSASVMTSRYISQALALGARLDGGAPGSVDTGPMVAGFDRESVDTPGVVAGFGGGQTRGRPPRARTGMPAALR